MYKVVVDPPITSSTYTRLIKECCVRLPEVKEYVGKCIAEFRKEAAVRKEEKNFKMTVKSETGRKLFILKVKGGFGGLTRTKYYVNHAGIYRYDWRAKAWKMLKAIAVVCGAAIVAGAMILRAAMPAIGFIDDLSFMHHNYSNQLEYKHEDYTSNDYQYDDHSNQLGYYKPEEDCTGNDYQYDDSSYNADHYSNSEYDDSYNEGGYDSDSDYEEYAYEEDDDDENYEQSYESDEEDDENIQGVSGTLCKYWNKPIYSLIRYKCCNNWCCCRYCHMDSLNHRVNANNSETYCKICCKIFNGNLICPNCGYSHKNDPNIRNIADRCTYLANASYIPLKSCCNYYFCCYRCHNKIADHWSEKNASYACTHCNSETEIDSKYCTNCDNFLMTDIDNIKEIARQCYYLTDFTYLIKFVCCSNIYCCPDCHNIAEKHKGTAANSLICMNCEHENVNKIEGSYCIACRSRFISAKSIN